jgi:uncharacterized protein YceK
MSEPHFDLRDSRRWRGLRQATLLISITLLAGCGTPLLQEEPKQQQPQRVNLRGYSDSFKQGYGDGCESAGSRSQRRNEGRYKTEADYMMGWNDGFSACRKGR